MTYGIVANGEEQYYVWPFAMSHQELTPLLWWYGATAAAHTFVLAPFGGGSAYSLRQWMRPLLAGHETVANLLSAAQRVCLGS